jgi:hypothetical protein
VGANDYDLGHHDAHSFLGDEPGLYVANSAVRAELPGAVQSLGGVPIKELNAQVRSRDARVRAQPALRARDAVACWCPGHPAGGISSRRSTASCIGMIVGIARPGRINGADQLPLPHGVPESESVSG